MAYSEALAKRVREVLDGEEVAEKKMFGGLCFMRRGYMTCGIVGDRLMLKLDDERAAEALKEPHTHPMDFTGRVIKSMLYVDEEGIQGKRALKKWLKRAVDFNDSLPERS